MLPTIGLPNKKSTPEQQMAMMRTYLNQLKDDTESELYNIKWENLSKPLQEKLTAMDGDLAATQEHFDYINANTVTTAYLEANYITATDIAATYVTTHYLTTDFIYTGAITAEQITAGTLASGVIYSGEIAANKISAGTFDSDVIYAGGIKASQINAGTISSDRLSASEIVTCFASGNTAVFNTINLGGISKSTSNQSSLRIYAGSGYANVYAQYVEDVPSGKKYQLMVVLPSNY